jgi:acrylyl-CoA reductase (NADPH)
MTSFRAYVVDKPDGVYTVSVKTLTESDLMEGDVTIRVSHSTVNYKDGLALTGKAPVVRKFPLIPGIDLSG